MPLLRRIKRDVDDNILKYARKSVAAKQIIAQRKEDLEFKTRWEEVNWKLFKSATKDYQKTTK